MWRWNKERYLYTFITIESHSMQIPFPYVHSIRSPGFITKPITTSTEVIQILTVLPLCIHKYNIYIYKCICVCTYIYIYICIGYPFEIHSLPYFLQPKRYSLICIYNNLDGYLYIYIICIPLSPSLYIQPFECCTQIEAERLRLPNER